MSSHKEKFTKGVFWNFIDVIGVQLISFIVSVILARKLNPYDFGTVAIVNSFISFALIFTSSGLNEAMIVKKDFSKETLNSVFLYNLLSALFIYGLIFMAAPYIADFYKNENLKTIIRILTFSLVISNSNNVHYAILYREVNFKKMLWMKLPGLFVSALVGVILAYQDFEVWALVWQLMILASLNSLMTWWFMRNHFSPNFKLYFASIKNLFSYSGKLVMSGILNKIFEIFYPLFIGKQYSAQDLGFYNRGVSIKDLIVNNIVQVVAKVSLPVFSDLTHDVVQLKNVYKKVMQATFFVITPIMFGGIVVSYNLIYTVYSSKWVFASPFFQLACVLGFLYPFHYINLDILKVFSRSALFFKLEVIKISLTIIAIFISYRYGIKGIMVGQISVSIIALFLNAFYSGELLKYGIIEQFRDLLAPILISIVMGVAIYFTGKLNYAIPMLLLIQLGCGMLVYFLLAFVFRIPIFFQLKSTLIHKLKVSR